MKNSATTPKDLKVTLTKDKLKFRSLASLQKLTKEMNLSTSVGKSEFDKAQLIDNLVKLGKGEPEYTPAGSITRTELEAKNEAELYNYVRKLGFKPSKGVSKEALIETILTYKGPAAVFKAPAETKKAETPAAKTDHTIVTKSLKDLAENIKFRYPTSKTEYVVSSIKDEVVVIKNVATEKPWTLKDAKELDRNVVVL